MSSILLTDFNVGNSFCRAKHKNGGVAIYLRAELTYKIIDVTRYCEELNFEITAIELDTYNLIVLAIYRSPNGKVETFMSKLEELLIYLARYKQRVIICGDVNAEFDITTSNNSALIFQNLLRQEGYYCINREPTRMTSCLDNIITNMHSKTYQLSIIQPNLSDHMALHLEITEVTKNKNNDSTKGSKVTFRQFTATGLENFKQSLNRIEWNTLINSNELNAEKTFNLFFITFLNEFNICFPEKSRTRNNYSVGGKRKNKFHYPETIAKMRDKLIVLNDMAKNNLCTHKFVKEFRRSYRNELRKAKFKHHENIIESADNKCKAAWQIINTHAKNNVNPKNNIDPDTFNSHFINTTLDISKKVPSTAQAALTYLYHANNIVNSKFTLKNVSCAQVLKAINKLRTSNSKDYYDLSNSLIKEVKYEIIKPLTYVLNLCINEGIFPDILKISKVIPIHKNGETANLCNYRPISLVPIFSKIFETILKEQLYQYFNVNGLFADYQYGFRTGRSTMDAVKSLIEILYQTFENDKYAEATFCDLSKAFDCVDHHILLAKLEFWGIEDRELEIFRSYLANRSQTVYTDGKHSQLKPINIGVPQGSVLGPLLFIIMINDVGFNIRSQTSVYADDVTFINVESSLSDLSISTKMTSDYIHQWFVANGFFLNDNKTQQQTYTLKSMEPSITDTVKFLGILIDKRLTWQSHINYVSTRLSRITYLLKNLTHYVSYEYVRSAYFAFFQSVMRYGLILWGSSSNISVILRIQKKAIRILTSSKLDEHCKPLFIQTKILTVINLYIYDILSEIKNNINEFNTRQNIHDHKTRYNQLIDYPYCRINKSKQYYKVKGIKLINKLPASMFDLSQQAFNKKIYNWLLKNPFYSVNEFLDCNITEL